MKFDFLLAYKGQKCVVNDKVVEFTYEMYPLLLNGKCKLCIKPVREISKQDIDDLLHDLLAVKTSVDDVYYDENGTYADAKLGNGVILLSIYAGDRPWIDLVNLNSNTPMMIDVMYALYKLMQKGYDIFDLASLDLTCDIEPYGNDLSSDDKSIHS